MLTHDFGLKLKGLQDTGTFQGFASTYGDPPDLTGDVIEPGAFKQAIQQQGSGYPLLWAHSQAEPIGIGRVEDSQAGLILNGTLVMEDPAAKRAYAHMKAGSVRGLSIGYSVPQGEGKTAYRDDGAQVLKEIRLHEISLVAIPANQRAVVTGVKALGDVRHMLKSLGSGVTDDQVRNCARSTASLSGS
jgi:HK97 family phage prohead protease